MTNRQTFSPPSLFDTAPTPSNSSTTNHPPSTFSSGSQPTATSLGQYPGNLSHTQLWLSSSHRLSEIEAANNAVAEESSVFGPAHAKALEELRTAQLQLAQAWMRSECEDVLDGEHAELAKRSFGRDVEPRRSADGANDGISEAGGAQQNGGVTESIPGSNVNVAMHGVGGFGGTGSGSLRGDGGMEMDTLLARKRRELNDAHFNRVSLSVVDVIQKLESVAAAMGVVETESREMWGSEVSDASSTK